MGKIRVSGIANAALVVARWTRIVVRSADSFLSALVLVVGICPRPVMFVNLNRVCNFAEREMRAILRSAHVVEFMLPVLTSSFVLVMIMMPLAPILKMALLQLLLINRGYGLYSSTRNRQEELVNVQQAAQNSVEYHHFLYFLLSAEHIPSAAGGTVRVTSSI